MPAINYYLVVLLYSGMAFASDGAACLQHLGGGRSDIECYSDLIVQQEIKIAATTTALLKTTGNNSKINRETRQYIRAADTAAAGFCHLQRLAVNHWKSEAADGMSEHRYADVVYRECLFLRKKQLQQDLALLLDGYSKAQ